MADTSPEILQERESCWPEILKRVPAKQLGVCRCVSQAWNSLISSSAFVSSVTRYISQTQLQSSNLFVIRSLIKENPSKKGKELFQICSESPPNKTKETLKKLIKNTIICPFKTSRGFYFRVVGSVNGVIYMSDDCLGNTYDFILWNPMVNCFIHLPKPRVCFDAIGAYMNASGFGYDCVNDDFKVIRIAYLQREDGLDETPPRAELYSVKEGKWRWVSAENVEYCITDSDWTQCFVKGRVHWVAYERWGEEWEWGHKTTLLLLFDVVKEKFQMMKLPEPLGETCPSDLSVLECQGMLCVFHHERIGGVVLGKLMQFNLWVKKEYNVRSSWSKMVSVDFSGSGVHKVLYWRNNGKLLALRRDWKMVSYDPETKSVAVLAKSRGHHLDVWSFVESLALLNEDCKNMRSIVPEEEDEDSSSDDEEVTLQDLRFKWDTLVVGPFPGPSLVGDANVRRAALFFYEVLYFCCWILHLEKVATYLLLLGERHGENVHLSESTDEVPQRVLACCLLMPQRGQSWGLASHNASMSSLLNVAGKLISIINRKDVTKLCLLMPS